MEMRGRNVGTRRVFGRDITNVDRRSKNASIVQKVVGCEMRGRARSTTSRGCEVQEPMSDYEGDIVQTLRQLQRRDFQELLVGVSEEMRLILIDWLVDVHASFELREQTLHLALDYLNTFTAAQEVSKQEYQLVGITCLWIASKVEEIYPHRMANYVLVTDSTYTVHELKHMENRILTQLHFNLTPVTSLQLLQACALKWTLSERTPNKCLYFCKYLLELSLFEGISRNYDLTTLVIACVCLADNVLKCKSDVKAIDNQQKDSVMLCFKEVCVALQNANKPNPKGKAIRRKYLDDKKMAVAKYRIQAK